MDFIHYAKRFTLIALFLVAVAPHSVSAATIAANTDASTAYSPAFMSGSAGYTAVNFTIGATTVVKTLVIADGGSCTWVPIAIKALNGPGTTITAATNTASVPNSDGYGRATCVIYFGGDENDPGVSLGAGTYTIVGGVNTPGGGGTWYGSASGSASVTGNNSLNSQNFAAFSSGGERAYALCTTTACSVSPSYNSTRIISTIPTNLSTIATSSATAIEALVYVHPDDYNSNLKVKVHVYNNARKITQLAAAIVAWDSAFGPSSNGSMVDKYFSWDAVSGQANYATTTPTLQIGAYKMVTTLVDDSNLWTIPFIGIQFGSETTLDSTTTQFLVSTSTAYDYLVDGNVTAYTALLDAQTLECTSWVTTLKACLFTILVPNGDDFDAVGDQLYRTFFSRVPFGYLTRFTEIMASSSPIALPAMTYSFGSSSPQVLENVTDGDPVTFNVFDHFDTLLSIRSDDGENKNLWDIVDPYWTMAVAFAAFFVILDDLIGLRPGAVKEGEVPEHGTLTRHQAIAARNKYLRDN